MAKRFENCTTFVEIFVWIVKEHGGYTTLIGAVQVKFEVQYGGRY
jgi:hypothetical protein